MNRSKQASAVVASVCIAETNSTNKPDKEVYMFRHSTNITSIFSVLMAALIFSLSLAGVAAAQNNTSLGIGAA